MAAWLSAALAIHISVLTDLIKLLYIFHIARKTFYPSGNIKESESSVFSFTMDN